MLKMLMHKTIVNRNVVKVEREEARKLLDFIEIGMQEEFKDTFNEHSEIVDLDYLNYLLLFYKKDILKKKMELNKDKNKTREKYIRFIKRSIAATEQEIKKVEKCIFKLEDAFIFFCKQDLNAEVIDYTVADTESISVTEQSLNSKDYSLLCSAYREDLDF